VAPGFLAVKPTPASPTSSLLNWYQAGPNVQAANAGIFQSDRGTSDVVTDFVIQTSASTHVIMDLLGFFIAPEATALQTIDATGAFVPLLAGGQSNTVSPNCPAGYAVTGGSCQATEYGMELVTSVKFSSSAWFCSYRNTSGVDAMMRADAHCARVPGR
jgi:hypothetical protein